MLAASSEIVSLMEYPYSARLQFGCTLSIATVGTNKKGGPKTAFP